MHQLEKYSDRYSEFITDFEDLKKTIRKPGECAPYILIRLAADCFKCTIFLYRDEFAHDISERNLLAF